MSTPLPKGYALVGKTVTHRHPETRHPNNALVVTGWLGDDRYMVVQKWYLDKYPGKTAWGSVRYEHLEPKGGNPDCDCWELNCFYNCCGIEKVDHDR